ncbi:MAG: universal stress protein, partial [Flavobacteriaceae bacterium]|nr:universal stress protein [Flavobacteriaceae bacterium]
AYTFDVICDYDAFISAVNQTVKLKSIDLIVMGTNGATGAKEVIFGSNTISVIRNVDRPVLVIPQKYKFRKPKRILFATEYDELFVEKSLRPLTYILSNYSAELEILMIENIKSVEQNRDKKEKIDEFYKGTKHNFYTISDVSADIAIGSFVQINNVDLVAKIINKESFFKRLLSKSSMSELTYKTKVPLLIMHS